MKIGRPSTISIISILYIALVCSLCLYSQEPATYVGRIGDLNKQVYDGDTIKYVRIPVWSGKYPDKKKGEQDVWPGVVITHEGVFVETDIRVAGIDTPERRPPTKKKDGTKRTKAERDRERQAAYAARDFLKGLIRDNNAAIEIRNAEHGKYAGRTVADVFIDDVNVASILIENGHAVAYDGGTKLDFEAWYQLEE